MKYLQPTEVSRQNRQRKKKLAVSIKTKPYKWGAKNGGQNWGCLGRQRACWAGKTSKEQLLGLGVGSSKGKLWVSWL